MVDLDLMTAASLLQGMYWKHGFAHQVSIDPMTSMVVVSDGKRTVNIDPSLAMFMASLLGELP